MFIAGMTGSGKSTLATEIARRWDRVLIYDPKDDPNAWIPNAAVCYGVKAARAALPGRVLYRPLPSENSRVSQLFDELAKIVFRATAHAIVIHEMGDLAETDRDVGTWLAACFRQGRSRRIPMIACTQRPVNVPYMSMSEANHFAAFTLLAPTDRKLLGGWMGPEVVAAPLPASEHRFWYRSPDLSLVRMPPLTLHR